MCGDRVGASARVVNFRTGAPSAHCAKVTKRAPAASSARRSAGKIQIGAWLACAGHHAIPA
eukprot:256758-Pleurochrysis_carterae.AAC.1